MGAERHRITETQHGNNSTTHLKYQMRIGLESVTVDDMMNGNMKLQIQSSIMKFVFDHMPEGMNAPTSLRWQNNKDDRSFSLLLDGISGPFTAYLAFPYMTLDAGSEFAVELIDANKTYRTSIISTSGKHYEHGKRYTAHIDNSFIWREKKEQNNKILVKMAEGKALTLPLYPEYMVSSTPNKEGYYEVKTMDNAEITYIPKLFFILKIEGYDYIGNADVKEVKIPSSVSYIGKYAFYDTSISSIELPKRVTYIGGHAFANTPLTSIEIPEGVSKIQEWAFFLCQQMKEVKLPSTVTTIESGAFNNCRKLERINFPKGLKTIGDNVFRTCLALTSITLPDGIISIGSNVFAFCEALQSVKWPASTPKVKSSTFVCCKGLKNVTLPASVNCLEDAAFYCCGGLQDVKIYSPTLTIGNGVFAGGTACNLLLHQNLKNQIQGKTWAENEWASINLINNDSNVVETIK